jgi:ComF family protein
MRIQSFIYQYLDSIQHLVFPNLCLQCQQEISRHEKYICAFCWTQLQRTYFEAYEEPSSMDKLFWGRCEIYRTFAFFYFEKEKPIQKILHALKYGHKEPLGIFFGAQMGKLLSPIKNYHGIEALIPVPIHPQKEFFRGYNQSESLATGLSMVLKIPVLATLIVKKTNNASQTGKNRFLRWENAAEQFSLTNQKLIYQHVAIVDDVITTGATLEAMVQLLRTKHPHLKISLISFAIAK